MVKKIKDLMYKPDYIRNIGIVAHIDHGKTTLSDNLLAAAGMISSELAGDQRFLDFDEQEQERGITIDAANVSMVHSYEDNEYLINLIDTPGHVDFGGDVTRAMRAVDGAVVVVCAVEGVMPQTETVLRQALKENVRPVLFINKVDRLINELKLDDAELQNRFVKIIAGVNKLIKNMAPEQYKTEWQVKIEDGTVAFGSAYHNWAINVPEMLKTNITFKDIIQYCNEDNQKELAQKIKIEEVILGMVVEHLPSPKVAQEYRVPKIYKSLPDLTTCGSIEKGSEIFFVGSMSKARTQQVGVYMGPERINTDSVPAGNIVAITGARGAIAGETITDADHNIAPFESLEHISEPVVTVAVEAKNTKDLPKLIEVLRQVGKEDPTLRVEINEETGEHLIAGMGELHLEVIIYRINDKGLEVETSEPIVVYRETIAGTATNVEGKSPNKHNRFYIDIEPLSDDLMNAISEGEIPEGRVKGKELAKTFQEHGLDKDEAKKVWDVYKHSIFVNKTRGIQYLDEIKELLMEGFESALDDGPLANEKAMGIKISLMDAKIHEDAVHRGPAQVLPAIRKAVYGAIMLAQPTLMEPMQKVYISVPQDYMGAATREVQNRRGQIVEMGQEGDMSTIESKVPVSEMFGFAGDIRSAAEGRCIWSTENSGFERIPRELQNKIVKEIRERKGLTPEPYGPDHYLG